MSADKTEGGLEAGQPKKGGFTRRSLVKGAGLAGLGFLAGIGSKDFIVDVLGLPPFPDTTGHRVFRVPSKALPATKQIFQEYKPLTPRFGFKFAGTEQWVLRDGTTVLLVDDTGSKDGISVPLPTSESLTAHAERAKNILESQGFAADLTQLHDSLILVRSNAWPGWDLVFRREWYNMPQPEFIKE